MSVKSKNDKSMTADCVGMFEKVFHSHRDHTKCMCVCVHGCVRVCIFSLHRLIVSNIVCNMFPDTKRLAPLLPFPLKSTNSLFICLSAVQIS